VQVSSFHNFSFKSPAKYIAFVLCLLVSKYVFGTTENNSPMFTIDTSVHIVDTDNDGMPDSWEIANGLNPNVNDANIDTDGDGLTNIEEYDSGTNPQVFEKPDMSKGISPIFSVSLVKAIADSDSDGMPDWWEIANGLNPNVNDAYLDSDGDGLINIEEYNGNWNPQKSEYLGASYSVSEIWLLNTTIFQGDMFSDTDGDGMPNWWEERYNLNKNLADADGDPDNDNISNINEYRRGLRPDVNDIYGEVYSISWIFAVDTIGLYPDTDGDGMRDWWEILHGLNPLVKDSNLDPDGDGRTNLEEYNADSDPNVDDNKGLNCFSSINFTVNTDSYNGQYLDDSDSDGMPDWWEIRYGLEPTVNDADGDEDEDGFTNLQEYNMGSNPLTHDTLIVSCYIEGKLFVVDTGGKYLDADNDGMPNWWERRFSGSTNGLVAGTDSDGDGHTALQEFITRSRPDDSHSVFHISTVAEPNPENPDEWVISWDTTEERIYKVYSHTNLMTQWPTESIYQVEGDGTPKSYTNAKENIQFRFYRVSVEMMPHE